MVIIKAETAGFCFGVKRAIRLSLDAASQEEVTSLGPLIHNPIEVKSLSSFGVLWADTMDEIKTKKVVIRSHGLPPRAIQELENRGHDIIDATCPIVKRAQRIAAKLQQEGYQVIIVGDKNHPEVVGILGCAEDNAEVVSSLDEAKELQLGDRIGLLSQTTQSEALFEEIVGYIQTKSSDVNVHNTICDATKERQKEVATLAKEVDMVLVIGGRNSANTKKLAAIAQAMGTITHMIEDVNDLKNIRFSDLEKVGITAGASTPNWIIEEVMEKMQELKGNDEVRNEAEGNETMEEQNLETAAEETAEETVAETTATEEPVVEEQAATESEAPAEDTADEPVAEEEAAEAPASEEAEEAEGTEPEVSEEAAPEENEKAAAAEEDGQQEETMAESYAAFNKDFTVIRRGERLTGTIIKVSESDLMVDIGGKSEGIIPRAELTPNEAEHILELFHEGDKVDVIVLRKENEDGHPVLSKKRVDVDLAWEKLSKAMESGEVLEGKVLDIVKGGLLVDVGLKGFVPASLVELGFVNQLENYRDQVIQFKVLECDKSHNKLILSRKAYLEEEKKRRYQLAWENIEEGQTRKGTVQRITNFGAFVDLDGVDGLLHVSQMAWYRVNHPSEVLNIGDEIDVYVLNVDRENEKISLGLKQLIPNPWTTVPDKYPVDAIVEAKVVRTATFGAFVQLEPGVEGLVHISQLTYGRVGKTEDAVNPGDIVKVKVLGFDLDSKKISLSIKEAMDPPAASETPLVPDEIPPADEYAAADEDDEPITIGEMIKQADEATEATEAEETVEEPQVDEEETPVEETAPAEETVAEEAPEEAVEEEESEATEENEEKTEE